MNKQGVRNVLEKKNHRRQNTMASKPCEKMLNVTNKAMQIKILRYFRLFNWQILKYLIGSRIVQGYEYPSPFDSEVSKASIRISGIEQFAMV